MGGAAQDRLLTRSLLAVDRSYRRLLGGDSGRVALGTCRRAARWTAYGALSVRDSLDTRQVDLLAGALSLALLAYALYGSATWLLR